MPEAQDPIIGKTLGKCRVEKLLGRGGMGAVYLAKHLTLNKQVAVKILPSATDENQQSMIKRFVREAQQTAKLEHTNVVQVYDVGLQSGLYYIVMQYVAGGTVDDMIRQRGRLPIPEALSMIYQAALGLAAAHDHNIIHRDMKPSNLLIDETGRVKVADFGLSRRVDTDSSLSQTGQILGTPKFMAPEQAKAEKGVDGRADIYSLGATLFYMLTGRAVFEGETPLSVVLKHVTEPPPLLSANLSEAPPELEGILSKMLAKEPAQRYQNCRELATKLLPIMARYGVAVDPSSVTAVRPPSAGVAAFVAGEPSREVTSASPTYVVTPAVGGGAGRSGSSLAGAKQAAVSTPAKGAARGASPAAAPPATGATPTTPLTTATLADTKAAPPPAKKRVWPWLLIPAAAIILLFAGISFAKWLRAAPANRELAAVEQWFNENPTEYREAIHKFNQVAAQFEGTDVGSRAKKRAGQVETEWKKDAEEAANECLEKAHALEKEKKLKDAFVILREYPQYFADTPSGANVANECVRLKDELIKQRISTRVLELIHIVLRQDMEAAAGYVDPKWLRVESREAVLTGLKALGGIGKLMKPEVWIADVFLNDERNRANVTLEIKIDDARPSRSQPQEWILRDNEWYMTKSGKNINKPLRPDRPGPIRPPKDNTPDKPPKK